MSKERRISEVEPDDAVDSDQANADTSPEDASTPENSDAAPDETNPNT